VSKILISLPEDLLKRLDETASAESRSRSELVREAVRRYLAEGPPLGREAAMAELQGILSRGRWNAEDLVRAERHR
jgi:metal-responsive CopG/Arc/MetJ family transcriptional regulator